MHAQGAPRQTDRTGNEQRVCCSGLRTVQAPGSLAQVQQLPCTALCMPRRSDQTQVYICGCVQEVMICE
jgi:hypothetical protein